jgi:hypothetical protein
VPKDSAYGLCFRMCIVDFLQEIEDTCHYRKTPYVMHVTVEDGDPNVKNAERIFEEVRATVLARMHIDPLGTFRTAKKGDALN